MSKGVTPIAREGGKQVYRVSFNYRGVQCREIIALPHSRANETYCRRLREEVLGKIERRDFRYSDYFPESKRAKLFDARGAGRKQLLKDALEAYRDRVKGTFAPSTFTITRKDIDNTLVPHFGMVALGDFKASHIREWVPTLTCGLKRLRNLVLPLRAVLAEAVHDEIIDINPFDRIDLARLLPEAKRRTDWAPQPYSESELGVLLGRLQGMDRWTFQLWAYTGLRTGELIGLRRENVSASALRIVETTTIGKDKNSPKTPAGVRTIPLLPAASQAVLAMLTFTSGGTGGRDRLARNQRGRRKDLSWDTDCLERTWSKAHEGTGIPYRNPYQLRHTFASNLLSQGEPPAKIARLLGHKTVEMVIRTYGRWIDQGEKPGVTAASYGATGPA